jgi:hypothetical protein
LLKGCFGSINSLHGATLHQLTAPALLPFGLQHDSRPHVPKHPPIFVHPFYLIEKQIKNIQAREKAPTALHEPCPPLENQAPGLPEKHCQKSIDFVATAAYHSALF